MTVMMMMCGLLQCEAFQSKYSKVKRTTTKQHDVRVLALCLHVLELRKVMTKWIVCLFSVACNGIAFRVSFKSTKTRCIKSVTNINT